MPELPTVEIHSPKDPGQKWIINAEDFDPEKYVAWGDPMPAQQAPVSEPMPAQQAPVSEPTVERSGHTPMRPSAPDYVLDEQGDIVAVNIINPEQRNARKEIPFGEYDPDIHELWSSHNRFQ